ncbi:MAG: helix-turn-helix domain-containing protein, partial [Pyrinomonadaceae bacterium]
IPMLAEIFAAAAAEKFSLPSRPIAPNALRRLVEYNWPGNVRELKNAMDRAVILAEGSELAARDLPSEGSSELRTTDVSDDGVGGLQVPFTADFREDRREFERRYISRCLEHTQGNVTRAAEILGMHRQSLQHKLRQLGLGRRYVSVAEEE